jgi:hypothetical protein
MPDKEALRNQIKEALKARYFPMILELPTIKDAIQQEKNRLSRSLAAFAIEKLADAAPSQAAYAVVDGYDDNGIDSIHFDRRQNRLFVVQSKIGDAPDMGENKKFCDGIRDLMAGRFDRFNSDFDRVRPEVEEALDTSGVIVTAYQAHLGDGLGPHAIKDLEALAGELNRFSHRFDWGDSGVSVVHQFLTSEHRTPTVDTELTLRRWHAVETPHRSFYGQVSAVELAAIYEQHGKTLFEKNIRHYLGSKPVNLAITETLQQRPSELFYLNNGLTAICSTATLKPGHTHDECTFVVKGLSIVNGAQTVGAIDQTAKSATGISAEANLLMTVIEIGHSDDKLGPSITKARNTQNAVGGLDFAALDPNQERLRRELMLSGVTYLYRPAAQTDADRENVISIEDAVLALAALSGKTPVVVAAKKEIGQLYDQTGSLYSLLFTDSLSGVSLARKVAIYRYVGTILQNSEQAETARSRRAAFYRHSVAFVLHILARRHQDLIAKAEKDLSDKDKEDLSRLSTEIAELIYTRAEAIFTSPFGYLSIFRTLSSSQDLSKDVMNQFASSSTQNAPPALDIEPTDAPAIPAQGATT